ncbi:hypothetical protein Bca101_029132 [Brassica carinata]
MKGETPNPIIDFSTSSYLRFALPPSQSTQIESLIVLEIVLPSFVYPVRFCQISRKTTIFPPKILLDHGMHCVQGCPKTESSSSHFPWLIMPGSAMVKHFVRNYNTITIVRELMPSWGSRKWRLRFRDFQSETPSSLKLESGAVVLDTRDSEHHQIAVSLLLETSSGRFRRDPVLFLFQRCLRCSEAATILGGAAGELKLCCRRRRETGPVPVKRIKGVNFN